MPEDKDYLVRKGRARKYARSQICCFVILSNGNLAAPSPQRRVDRIILRIFSKKIQEIFK